MQQGDLPRGMVRCDLSGDIKPFIQKERTSDQSAGDQASTQWTQLQKSGATDAYVAIYADTKTECGALTNPGANPSVTTSKLAVSIAVHFKDEKSAADAYAGGAIFGQKPSDLRSAQSVEGTKTGLTANSIVVDQSLSTQTFYVALWQNQAFIVYLVAIDLDPSASKKIALAENGRIK